MSKEQPTNSEGGVDPKIGGRRASGLKNSERAFFISQFSVSGLLVGETIRSAVVDKNYGEAAIFAFLSTGSIVNNIWALRRARS